MASLKTSETSSSIPIHLVSDTQLASWLKAQPKPWQTWLKLHEFNAASESFVLLPNVDGTLGAVVVGVDKKLDVWSIAHLPTKLPTGKYHFATAVSSEDATRLTIGWQLGGYQFSKYKKTKHTTATLDIIKGADAALAAHMVESISLARDLINTPANDMHTLALADAAKKVAAPHKATCKLISGEQLIKQKYPAIYAVGKASSSPPALVDFTWGNPKHKKVTLVGKGVCFDTGGLDIKSSSNMLLMKKDMGGAANVLALANLIMSAKLPVRLRVLLPIVENAVSGNAMRPSDVIQTRKGLTVEVGNTDAEGRLILCDALFEADKESPDLLIDCATLTGAARVALGTDVPAFFTHDDALATSLTKHAAMVHDPLWRLPLVKDYASKLKSNIADINNDPSSGYGGAISAALFLDRFVDNCKSWLHIDMMAWNISARPGRPIGGEAQTIRALFSMIKERYDRR
jgi:leucyl aminopeptidase